MPRWVWRGALAALVLIVSALMIGALALAAGAADPPVAGPLARDLTLDAERGTVALPAKAEVLLRSYPLPAPDTVTLEVTAALDGASDAACGLWLQPCNRRARIVIALDGDGYFALFPYPGDHARPWAWFLHAKARPAANRLRVDLRGGSLTLRINDEIAQTAPPIGRVCAWGLYAATGLAGDAGARFTRVRLWMR